MLHVSVGHHSCQSQASGGVETASAPVAEHVAPAPVAEYTTPALAVRPAPAPVIVNVAPPPVTDYETPAMHAPVVQVVQVSQEQDPRLQVVEKTR